MFRPGVKGLTGPGVTMRPGEIARERVPYKSLTKGAGITVVVVPVVKDGTTCPAGIVVCTSVVEPTGKTPLRLAGDKLLLGDMLLLAGPGGSTWWEPWFVPTICRPGSEIVEPVCNVCAEPVVANVGAKPGAGASYASSTG